MRICNFLKSGLLLLFLFVVTTAIAQDRIVRKSGDDIEAKVVEVEIDKIKYKKFDNQSGPTYSIAKEEVFMILYANGTKDVFGDAPAPTNAAPVTPPPAPQQATTPKPTPAPTPTPPPAAAPAPTQIVLPPAPAYTNSYEPATSSRLAIMFTGGGFAPIGLFIGGLNEKRVGMYGAFRMSPRLLSTSADFELSGNKFSDDFWDLHYTDVSDYNRGAVTLGITYGFSENVYIYGGAGLGAANYHYAYWQFGPYTGEYYDVVWVKDTDLSTMGAETELGLILNFGGFCLQGGVTAVNFSEAMGTFGIGVSF